MTSRTSTIVFVPSAQQRASRWWVLVVSAALFGTVAAWALGRAVESERSESVRAERMRAESVRTGSMRSDIAHRPTFDGAAPKPHAAHSLPLPTSTQETRVAQAAPAIVAPATTIEPMPVDATEVRPRRRARSSSPPALSTLVAPGVHVTPLSVPPGTVPTPAGPSPDDSEPEN